MQGITTDRILAASGAGTFFAGAIVRALAAEMYSTTKAEAIWGEEKVISAIRDGQAKFLRRLNPGIIGRFLNTGRNMKTCGIALMAVGAVCSAIGILIGYLRKES